MSSSPSQRAAPPTGADDLRRATFWGGCSVATVLWLVGSVYAAATTPWTVDEPTYVTAGEILRHGLVWDTGTARLHGPLPFYANQFAAHLGWPTAPLAEFRLAGRLGMLVFGLAGAWTATALARAWFDRRTAVATLFLYAVCPVLLVHGSLITTDNSLVPFFVGALAVTWWFLSRPRWPQLPLLGVLLGAALATKYLGLFLVPILGLAVVGALLRGFRPALCWSRDAQAAAGRRVADAMLAVAVVGASAWVTLWACYGFRPPAFDPTQSVTSSAFFARLLQLPVVPGVLGALPEPWVLGVDYMKYYSEAGGLAWFAGRVGDGHPLYYVTAVVTKLPLATLAALAAGLLVRTPRWPRHALWIWTLGVGLPLAYLSLFQALQIGLRHMLQVLPLLLLVAGRGLAAAFRPGRLATARRVLGAAVVVWSLGFLVVHRGDLLGAFNLATPRPEWLFVDSNITWTSPTLGADPQRAALLRAHPDAQRIHRASGPRLGTAYVLVTDFAVDTDDAGRPRHWLAPLRADDRFGGWLVHEVQLADLVAAADRAPTGQIAARIRLDAAVAAAFAGRLDRAEALLAAAPVEDLDPRDHPRRAALARLTAVRRARPDAAVPADLALGLGRFDLVLDDPAAPAPLRARAAFERFEWPRALQLLEQAAAGAPLQPQDVLLRIALLRLLERPEEALAVLDSLPGGPEGPLAEALAEMRAELVRLRDENQKVARRRGRR